MSRSLSRSPTSEELAERGRSPLREASVDEHGHDSDDDLDPLERTARDLHDPGQAQRAHGEAAGEHQPDASEEQGTAPAEEHTFKQKQWKGTQAINAQYFKSIGKELAIDRLAWDVRLEFGQSRTVDDNHVQQLVTSLQLRPPREALKINCWENEVDRKLYILAGQHLCRAVQRIREDRLSHGLHIEDWQRTVRADILRFDTPVEVRRVVAGQENASTRISRATTVSECIKLFLLDNTEETFHNKVVRAVEQAGLNQSAVTPVCFHSKHIF